MNCETCLTELVEAYTELNGLVQDDEAMMHPCKREQARVECDRLGAQLARVVMCRKGKDDTSAEAI